LLTILKNTAWGIFVILGTFLLYILTVITTLVIFQESEDDRGKKIMHDRIYPKYFKAYQWHGRAVPVDFETLKTANDFLIALDYCATSAGYFSSVNNRKQERARGLLELIKKELGIDQEP